MKKITRRNFLALVAAAGATTALAACSSDSSTTTTTSSTSTSSNSSSGDEIVHVTLWDYNTTQQEMIARYIEEYKNVAPNVEIELVDMSGLDTEYWTKLAAAIASSGGPDLFSFHNQQSAAFAGTLAPFPKDIFPDDYMAETYFAYEAAFTINGDCYFMPAGTSDGQIYYNKAIFAEKGIPEPESIITWDEFGELAEKLTEYDSSGMITATGCSINGFGQFMWPDTFLQAGGTWYNDDGSEVLWNDEAGLAATEFFYDLFNVYRVDSNDFLNYDEAFYLGLAAMAHSRSFFGMNLDSLYPDIDYGVISIPVMDKDVAFRGRNNYECGYAASASSTPESQAAAFEFLKWLNGPDYQLEVNLLQKRIPAHMGTWEDPSLKEDKVLAISLEQTPRTVFVGDVPSGVLTAIVNMLTKLYMGQDAASALSEATEEANLSLQTTLPAFITEQAWKESLMADLEGI